MEQTIPHKYVVATFEPCDLTERVEDYVAEYFEGRGILDDVVTEAAEWLRDYYAEETDPYYDAIREAVRKVGGQEALAVLDS